MIVETLLRLAIYRALIGRTLAGLNVCDSRLGLFDESMAKDDEYVIVVRSDDQTLDDLFEARSSRSAIIIEMMVTSRMEGSQDEPDNAVVRDIPVTTSGIELVLGMLGAQVLAALRDLDNPWSSLVKRLMVRGHKARIQRGGNEKNSTRRAALQIVLESDLLSEPVLGEQLPVGVISDAIAAMEADTKTYGLEVYGRSLRQFFEASPIAADPAVACSALARSTGDLLRLRDLHGVADNITVDTPLPGENE